MWIQFCQALILSCSMLLFLFNAPSADAASERFGLTVYGFSYHPDLKDSQGNKLEGWNPGMGVSWNLKESERFVWNLEGGLYRDSSKDLAEYFSFSCKAKVIPSIRLGAALSLIHSVSYNQGRPILAPLPVATYWTKFVSVNFLYAPRYKEINKNSVFAIYATVPLQ